MNISELKDENKIFIRTVFNEMRTKLQEFMKQRDFLMSNPQLFTFLSNSPAAFAIAADGNVDETEIAALEKMAKVIDVKATVSLDLAEMMALAKEPDNCMINEEFNLRAGSELLFLARNAEKFENDFVAALKGFLAFDFNPKAEGSMTSSFLSLMDFMIENNVSTDKEKEKKKIDELKQKLGV